MQIIVSKIPPEGLPIHIKKEGEWFHRQVSKDLPDQFSVGTIEFRGTAEKVRRNVSIKGEIFVEGHAQCSRCLENYPISLKGDVSYVMTPEPEAQTGEEIELEKDELDLFYYKDDTIDLEPEIFQQVLLLLPIKPLCEESCRGLCPVCGINLNKESCDHKIEEIKSPFAALKNFKVTKKRS